jgi:hypothetical protein
MAEKSAKSAVQTETYAGPGRISSAFGGWVLWGIPGAVGHAVSWTTRGRRMGLLANLAGLGLSIYGAVSGWGKAARAEQQYGGLKAQILTQDARNEGLQAQVNGLTQEVETYRKSYAQGVQSRAEQGSHAEAAQADKAAAAEAVAAR